MKRHGKDSKENNNNETRSSEVGGQLQAAQLSRPGSS